MTSSWIILVTRYFRPIRDVTQLQTAANYTSRIRFSEKIDWHCNFVYTLYERRPKNCSHGYGMKFDKIGLLLTYILSAQLFKSTIQISHTPILRFKIIFSSCEMQHCITIAVRWIKSRDFALNNNAMKIINHTTPISSFHFNCLCVERVRHGRIGRGIGGKRRWRWWRLFNYELLYILQWSASWRVRKKFRLMWWKG